MCQALRNYDPGASIKRYLWSGDNLQHVREDEADRLADWILRDAVSHTPAKRYVIIAHSHGGNIAASLGRFPTVVEKVECIICLATPFIEYDFGSERTQPLSAVSAVVIAQALGLSAKRAFEKCSWTSWWSSIGLYLAPIIAVGVGGGLDELRGRILRRLRKRANLSRRHSSSIPPLVLTTAGDEAFLVLKLLTFSTFVARWSKVVILGLISFLFLIGGGGTSNCGLLGQEPFDWLNSIVFGFQAGVLIAIGLLILQTLTAVFELIWTPLVLLPLHLLRGSRRVSAILSSLGLPRISQSGFGETFLQTLLTTTRVRRVPDFAKNVRLEFLDYGRNGEPVLHSGVYHDPVTFQSMFGFLDTKCQTGEPGFESDPREVSVVPGPDLMHQETWVVEERITDETIELGVFVPVLAPGDFLTANEGVIVRGLLESFGILVEEANGLYLVQGDQLATARAILKSRRQNTPDRDSPAG